MKYKIKIFLFLLIILFPVQQSIALNRVVITSEPVGVLVILDGNYLGKTPLSDVSLPWGSYNLEFRLEGYKTEPYHLNIISDEPEYNINVKLTPLPGSIYVESSPVGAYVYMDGEKLSGTTPLTIQDATKGPHNIQVVKEKFLSETKSVNVEFGKTTSVEFSLSPYINPENLDSVAVHPESSNIDELIPMKSEKARSSRIVINSEPIGIPVLVNNNRIGVTNLTQDISPGTYEIRLTFPGYIEEKFQLTLKPGETKSKTVRLTKLAMLFVKSQPENASVYLDNTIIGSTPIMAREVIPGSHTIRVVYQDYDDYVKTCSFAEGKKVEIKAKFGNGINLIYIIYIILGTIGIGVIATSIVLIPRLIRYYTKRYVERSDTVRIPIGDIMFSETTQIASSFGDYELLEEIGRSRMAVVYQAQHRKHSGIVALKIPSEDMMQDEKSVKRFLRQIEIGMQLSHPCIVKILDSGMFNELPYLAMEYIKGGDLRKHINKQGPLSIQQAVRYIIQICEALDYVHLKQIYHRDIKPENILLTEDDHVKVVDFGIALAKQMPEISLDDERWGSYGYICLDREISPASDFYSLGIMFYEMLTGHLPFESNNKSNLIYMHKKTPLPPFRQWRDDIPKDLESIVMKMTAKNPENRYQQAMEIIQTLKPYEL